ncbi:MAG: radical SAM protein, partial [Elusimicrobia bacterium CG11_big_fil_rev_8_21_14_0_20_64_6]
MANNRIFFADLTHTAQGISAPTFPLGVSYVASYVRQQLGKEFDFHLFKFPADLERALVEAPPLVLCLSNYSWNFELAYKLAALAKARYPDMTVVCGGPNFPTNEEEQHEHLRLHPVIDFYIQLEGEIGTVDLIRKLAGHGFDARKLKASGQPLLNTAYLTDGKMITGPLDRIKDINTIPSPYLSGLLDPFFEMKLIPMVETTRGCPFSCTFCADGLQTKNKVVRYHEDRTRDELEYIAARIKN